MFRWLENDVCKGLDKLYLLASIFGATYFQKFVAMSQRLTLNRENVLVALDEKICKAYESTVKTVGKRNVARQ